MLPIGIDISDVISEFSQLADKSEELSSFVLDRIVENYMFTWHDKVKNELHQTRSQYIKSMYSELEDSHNAVVGLYPTENNIPMMIEDGASSWDMREGFENSSKTKEVKRKLKDGGEETGWYLTIPFREATAEAIGESTIFSGKMPEEIQEIAKKVSPAAIALQDLPKQYQDIGLNKTTGTPHKSPIYLGTKKNQVGATQKENRGAYVSFRRVSDKSDEGSWQHPGFEAKKFMERTASDVLDNREDIVDKALSDFMESLGW